MLELGAFKPPGGLMVSIQHPGLLAAAALGGVDDERALAEGDAGEAAGDDGGLLAVKDERAQVDVPAGEALALAMRRVARQRDHRLADVVARIGEDAGEIGRAHV